MGGPVQPSVTFVHKELFVILSSPRSPRNELEAPTEAKVSRPMATTALDDPILKRFHTTVSEIYGDRLERVVLYGSRARGDAQPDSDYDIAVFLHDMPDRFAEVKRLAYLATDILYSEGELVHAMPFPAGAYNERTPLMHEIRREGIDL